MSQIMGKSVQSDRLNITVLVDGVPRQILRRFGDGFLFVEMNVGDTFTFQVDNRLANRIEVLHSMDSRNTLRDEAAHVVKSQGMVIPALRSWQITGWRLNLNNTVPFVIKPAESSVAAEVTGSTAQTGVIGFAVYQEEMQRYVPRYAPFSEPPNEALRGGPEHLTYKSPTRSSGLGTGMGDHINQDRVGQTDFKRASSAPSEIVAIYYGNRQWLVEQGVIFEALPSPFIVPTEAETGYGSLFELLGGKT